MTSQRFDLEERTARFARNVREFVVQIPKSLSNSEDIPQLVRSSGSVAANYIEANEALGSKDFAMRVRICLKEAKESRLWLSLLSLPEVSKELKSVQQTLIDEAHQLVRIFSVILRNFKNKNTKTSSNIDTLIS